MVDGITDSMEMSLSKLWELVLQSMGSQRVRHDPTTKNINISTKDWRVLPQNFEVYVYTVHVL